MLEKETNKVTNRCKKIAFFIRIAWCITLLAAFLGWSFLWSIVSANPTESSANALKLTATSIDTETIYTFVIGKETWLLPTNLTNSLNENALQKPLLVFILLIVWATIILTTVALILSFLRKIFLNISNGDSPFTKENCSFIRKIGWTFLAYSLLSPIVFPLFCAIWGVGNLSFDSSGLSLISVGSTIFLGSIIFALSYIFEYGTLLQQESDELL